MRNLLNSLMVLCLLAMGTTVNAQTPDVKFGEVPLDDLKMQVYPQDSNASAAILFDIGSSKFNYNTGTKEWQIYFERHVRIKILSEEGFDWADFRVKLYNNSGVRENLSGLKAYTFNMENGRPTKEKLDKKTVFTEEISESWSAETFTMPNVKAGSVIDVTYKVISSYYYRLEPWYFQQSIPVRWSEYTVSYPEYYDYKLIYGGYHPLVVNDFTTNNKSVTLFNGRTASPVSYIEKSYRWASANVPAFRDESFITTEEDYITKIELELSSINYPGRLAVTVLKDWPDINHDLMESSKFGQQIKRTAFVKEVIDKLRAEHEDDFQFAFACVQHLKQSMSYNGKRRYTAETNVRDAYMKKQGNSAEINLLLVGMLREGGLNANPVLTSTRNHGRVHPVFPMMSKFNNVMAHVQVGDQELILDATEPMLPPNMLPVLCQVERGRLLSETGSRWVSVSNGEQFVTAVTADITLDPSAAISGTLNYQMDGYAGFIKRKEIEEDGESAVKQEMINDHASWSVEDDAFQNYLKPDAALTRNIEFSSEEGGDLAGDMIYLTPMIIESTKENPFKAEKRDYPVDFIAPYQETVSITIHLPEGYAIEEMPQPMMLSLPDGSGKFMFNISPIGDKVQVLSRVMIKKAIYLPEDYGALRQFFEQIVSKQSEQLVIKKS